MNRKPMDFARKVIGVIAPSEPSGAYVCPYTLRLEAALLSLEGKRVRWVGDDEVDGRVLSSLCVGNSEVGIRFKRLARVEYVVAQWAIHQVSRVAFFVGGTPLEEVRWGISSKLISLGTWLVEAQVRRVEEALEAGNMEKARQAYLDIGEVLAAWANPMFFELKSKIGGEL